MKTLEQSVQDAWEARGFIVDRVEVEELDLSPESYGWRLHIRDMRATVKTWFAGGGMRQAHLFFQQVRRRGVWVWDNPDRIAKMMIEANGIGSEE